MSPDAERVLLDMAADLSAVEWSRLLGVSPEAVERWCYARRLALASPPPSRHQLATRIAHLEAVVARQRATIEGMRIALADAHG